MRFFHLCAIVTSLAVVSSVIGADPEPLKVPGRGTLKGKVTLDGQLPGLAAENAALLATMRAHANANCCLAGGKDEQEQQKWRIGAKGGVANVVVFLRPPPGFYFKMTRDDLDPKQAGWSKTVEMDQPHCAFVPHVAVLFPSYYDPAAKDKETSTGQVFKMKNSANVAHNSMWGGPRRNPGANPILQPGQVIELPIKSDIKQVPIKCVIHPWMNAWVWALDHPFAAITDKDGNYEIKNVPAGVAVRVVAWHETGFLMPSYIEGDPIEIPVGKTKELDFKAKPE